MVKGFGGSAEQKTLRLGYTFGPARHWRTRKRFIAAQPSKKSQKRLKEKVNTLLFRGNPTPWPEPRDRLNRLLTGWAEYFSFGFTGQAADAVRSHVTERVGSDLSRFAESSRPKLWAASGGTAR